MDFSPTTAPAPSTPAPSTGSAPSATADATGRAGAGEHPLIWLALLVWLSVEGIGEGLRSLASLLAQPATTATPLASGATTESATAEPLPTPQVTPS